MKLLKRLLSKIRFGIGLAAGLMLLASIVLGYIALAVAVIVGAWDLLVWLTNSDWKTTEFVAPFYSGVLFIVLLIVNRLFLIPIVDWVERTDSN